MDWVVGAVSGVMGEQKLNKNIRAWASRPVTQVLIDGCGLPSSKPRFDVHFKINWYEFSEVCFLAVTLTFHTLMRYRVMSRPAMSKRRVKWGSAKPSYTGQMCVTPSPESTTTPVSKPTTKNRVATCENHMVKACSRQAMTFSWHLQSLIVKRATLLHFSNSQNGCANLAGGMIVAWLTKQQAGSVCLLWAQYVLHTS